MLATQMAPHKPLGSAHRKMHIFSYITYIFWTELQNLVIYSGSPAEFLGSYCMQRTECRTVVYSEDMKWSHDGGTLLLLGNTLHCMFKGWSLLCCGSPN